MARPSLPPSVVGIGVDIVDIARFEAVVARTPRIVERVFAPQERAGLPARSLAARFAAKEAVAKVLVTTHGLQWHDCRVITGEHGQPMLDIDGTVAHAASALGIDRWHLSLSHDGGHAIAYVIAESLVADPLDDADPR